MKYNGAVVTSNGSSFLSGLVANKKSAILDKIIILNTDVPSNKTIDSMTAQDFSNGMSFDINNVSQNDNSFTATSVVSNTGNVNNYPAMLVGLFGYYDGSSERTLLSVSKAVDPFVIEKDTGTPVKLSVSITVGFSSSQQINLTVKDDVYVTNDELKQKNYANQSDLNQLQINVNNNLNSPDSDINKRIANRITFDKDEDIQGIKDFQNGVKISGNSVYVQNDKLMYKDKPVLVAKTPNAPKLDVSIDKDTSNIQYKITPPNIDGGASITGYTLFYKKESDADFTSLKIDESNLIGEMNVDKGVNYQLKASSSNYAGDSFDSPVQSIFTATEPKQVSIKVDNQYPKGIHYHINVTDDGNSNVTGYQIFYKADSDTNWQMFPYNENDGYILSVSNDINYQVKVKAQNIVGLSNESIIQDINYYDNRIFGITYKSGDLHSNQINSVLDNNSEIIKFITPVKDKYGNCFIRFPKVYLYKDNVNGLRTFKITKEPHYGDGWYLPKCFYDFRNNEELPYIDVGQFTVNPSNELSTSWINKYYSGMYSGSANTNRLNLNVLNTNGEYRYQLLDFHILDVLLTMYNIENLKCVNISNFFDTVKNYHGLNWYPNWNFIDGIYYTNGNILVCDDAQKYYTGNFGYPYNVWNNGMQLFDFGNMPMNGYGGLSMTGNDTPLCLNTNMQSWGLGVLLAKKAE